MKDTKNQEGPQVGSEPDQAVVRGRPGRRSLEDRLNAAMELLSGKASVDQVARRYGVQPETVEGWRESALAGVDLALLTGGRSERERELEKQAAELRDALGGATVERAVALNAVEEWKKQTRPSRPRRSSR